MSTVLIGVINPFKLLINKKKDKDQERYRRLAMEFVNNYNNSNTNSMASLYDELLDVRDRVIRDNGYQVFGS